MISAIIFHLLRVTNCRCFVCCWGYGPCHKSAPISCEVSRVTLIWTNQWFHWLSSHNPISWPDSWLLSVRIVEHIPHIIDIFSSNTCWLWVRKKLLWENKTKAYQIGVTYIYELAELSLTSKCIIRNTVVGNYIIQENTLEDGKHLT